MKISFKAPIKLSGESLGLPGEIQAAPEVSFELGGTASTRASVEGEFLDIPLHEPPQSGRVVDPDAKSIFELLEWRTRSDLFIPRDEEFQGLWQWAESNHAISVKLITGEGGSGKSALAAAFALKFQEKGWHAGFAHLDKSRTYDLGDRGLVVLDYPEEHPAVVRQFLVTLGQQRTDQFNGRKVRVLLLTRRPQSSWEQTFIDVHAVPLVDPDPINLFPLTADTGLALKIFLGAQESANKTFPIVPLAENIDEDSFTHWLSRDEKHRLPLFIVAAGVHRALYPDVDAWAADGRQILIALARRELGRLRNLSSGAGYEPTTFPLLTAYAAMAGGLSSQEIEKIAASASPPKITALQTLLEAASNCGLIRDRVLPPPTPDIVAACLTILTIREQASEPVDILWLGLRLIPRDRALAPVERLMNDSETVL